VALVCWSGGSRAEVVAGFFCFVGSDEDGGELLCSGEVSSQVSGSVA
jgi:hypothetical protein